VTGAKGPEAGVWVIGETKDLPTRYVKIDVTDDQGHYLIPDLPKGTYDIWVRGYGLVDSPNVKSQPGKTIDLKAVAAPSRAAAGERRLQSGQASAPIMGAIGRFDTQRALSAFGDWTDRVGKCELPKADPPRPAGIERNVVVTEWDWNTPKAYLHDEISTDRRN